MRRIVFCSLSFILLTSAAYADGCFVWRSEDVDIREPRQKALIVFAEGVEELVLAVQCEGAVEDFAWLVPLPSAPEVRVVELETFEMLRQATRLADMGRSSRFDFARSAESGDDVNVLDRRTVGIYDIAVLEGGAGGGLVAWLAEQGFRIPAHATPVIDSYLDRDWVFAAMRISPTAVSEGAPLVESLADGTIQPVMFRFACDEPVYPLQISSIMQRQAEVLLYVVAEDALVCSNTEAVDWEVGVFGRMDADRFMIPDYLAHYEGTNVLRDTTSYMTETATRYFTERDGAALTRLRATFAPDQMMDLVFGSYPAIEELASDDLARRIQAATYLGVRPSRDAVAPLMEMMWRSNANLIDQEDALQFYWEIGYYPDQDVVSALWALGRIGAGEAEIEVTRWAQGDNPRCALEALDTLREIAPQTATEICLEILSGARTHLVDCEEEKAMIAWSRDWLIAHGGPDATPVLGGIVKDRYTPSAWDDYDPMDPDPGVCALLAAAACGDETAQAELSGSMKRAALGLGAPDAGDPGRRGSTIGNYPADMVLGVAILHSRYGARGAPLRAVQEHLAGRPAVRDSLLRRVAHDPELGSPADGRRAVLLSKVETLDDRDVDLLNEIWDHALAQPRFMRMVFRGSHAASDTVTYNVDAVAAAYALGTHGRVAELLACWRDVSWDDVDMKGELALALGLTGDPAGAPAVLEYIRTVWNRNVAAPSLVSVLGSMPPPPYDWPLGASPDLRYRVKRITGFIVEHAWDEVPALVEDESLDPLLRTFWALDPLSWWESPTARYVESLRELRPLVGVALMQKRIDWKIEQALKTLSLLAAQ